MFLIITAVSFFIFGKRVESRKRESEREGGRRRVREGEGGRERGREEGEGEMYIRQKQAKITESMAPVTHNHFFTKYYYVQRICSTDIKVYYSFVPTL